MKYLKKGKHFLTLGVAVIAITMLQPISQGKIVWFILLILGIILIRNGSE